MSGAREFLSKVLPWELAGPNVYFNLHWKFPFSNPKPGRTHGWDGRAFNTLDEFVRGVEYWSTHNDKDLYVCMSAQSRAESVVAKNGRPYLKAIRFQENVVGLRGFYIDIDVKPESYPTTFEAVTAFNHFLTAVDMPDPTCIVQSGSGGFHAHWTLKHPITLAEWQPLANALQHAVAKSGLIADTQCTIDSARILRIPGTKNLKTSAL